MGVIVMKKYSTFPKVPELALHHQVVLCHTPDSSSIWPIDGTLIGTKTLSKSEPGSNGKEEVLHSQKAPELALHHQMVLCHTPDSSSIWPIDGTLIGTKTLSKSEPGSNGKEEVLHSQKAPELALHHQMVLCHTPDSSSIWPIDGTLIGTKTLSKSEPGSNGKEEVLHSQKAPELELHHQVVLCHTPDSSSIWPIDGTLIGTKTLSKSEPGSNGKEEVLHSQKAPELALHHQMVLCHTPDSSSIWPIDGTLIGTKTLSKSEPGSNGKEEVLHSQKAPELELHHQVVLCHTPDSSSIWPIDGTLIGTKTLSKSEPGSNGKEEVLHSQKAPELELHHQMVLCHI